VALSVTTEAVTPVETTLPTDVTPIPTATATKTPETYYKMKLTKKDSYLLAKIAMAEAEGEPLKGKELVIMVVLNRMLDDEFPDNVHDVIYQEKQFSPIADGRFDKVEPNADCWKALKKVKSLENDFSEGALYFENCANADNWHSRNLTFLYEYGNHKFYK
jgi:N-acetylmuramoyl-L-alanine amidase